MFSSPDLLEELADILCRTKFAARLEAYGTSSSALVDRHSALVSLATPWSVRRVVVNDADDDHVIAAAAAARADFSVTGDRRHLLPIGSHEGIAIVTPRAFVRRLEAGRRD